MSPWSTMPIITSSQPSTTLSWALPGGVGGEDPMAPAGGGETGAQNVNKPPDGSPGWWCPYDTIHKGW